MPLRVFIKHMAGIVRLRAMAKDNVLLYPILATNDTPTKWET